jgi:hypothetical protein
MQWTGTVAGTAVGALGRLWSGAHVYYFYGDRQPPGAARARAWAGESEDARLGLLGRAALVGGRYYCRPSYSAGNHHERREPQP